MPELAYYDARNVGHSRDSTPMVTVREPCEIYAKGFKKGKMILGPQT